jgi:cell wall-associated NlpC family hydrolase
MSTPIELLEAAAQSWVGTPFCERSAVKGCGVCCHRAVSEVYIEAGFMPRVELPDAPPHYARAQHIGLMEGWLDGVGAEWFTSLTGDDLTGQLQAGDLLGFRLGRAVHHLAIQLTDGRIYHAAENIGVIIAPKLPQVWATRLVRAWRPKGM